MFDPWIGVVASVPLVMTEASSAADGKSSHRLRWLSTSGVTRSRFCCSEGPFLAQRRTNSSVAVRVKVLKPMHMKHSCGDLTSLSSR